jgi:antitoxin VapB
VIESLRERHERLQKQKSRATLEDLMAIARRASREIKRPYLDHADLLYDEHGLPK